MSFQFPTPNVTGRSRQASDLEGRAAIAFIKAAKTEEEFNKRKDEYETSLIPVFGRKVDTGLRFEPPEFVQSEIEPTEEGSKKTNLLVPGLIIGGLVLLG